MASDCGRVSVLALLDLSDTADHSIDYKALCSVLISLDIKDSQGCCLQTSDQH